MDKIAYFLTFLGNISTDNIDYDDDNDDNDDNDNNKQIMIASVNLHICQMMHRCILHELI